MRTLAILALLGALVQACSDNKGPAGPAFPAGQIGHADTTTQTRVQVAVNPNSIQPGQQAGVTVLVTNLNGRALPGKHVQLSTTVGTLSVVDGFTDRDGKFVSFLRVTPADAVGAPGSQATITAFVDGAIGTGVVNFGAPATLFLSPSAIDQNNSTAGVTCSAGGFSTQFTVSGGVPPYRFANTAGLPGSTITESGLYTVSVFILNVGADVNDVVTVTDAVGNSIAAAVNISCVDQ